MKSGVCVHCTQQLDLMSCVMSRRVKASHWWWICNKPNHTEGIPEQYASKIVKILQQIWCRTYVENCSGFFFSGTLCMWSNRCMVSVCSMCGDRWHQYWTMNSAVFQHMWLLTVAILMNMKVDMCRCVLAWTLFQFVYLLLSFLSSEKCLYYMFFIY